MPVSMKFHPVGSLFADMEIRGGFKNASRLP
jgi:hypothetical protein